MSVTIRIGIGVATVADGQWSCSCEPMRRLLNTWRRRDMPSSGDRDVALAEAAARRLGGERIRLGFFSPAPTHGQE